MHTVHSHELPEVPITLRVANVNVHGLGYRSPVHVEFSAFHLNGESLQFAHRRLRYPIRVVIDEKTLKRRFSGDQLDDKQLIESLSKCYEGEVAKRTFKLLPYFTEANFRYWYLHVVAHRQMAGLCIDEKSEAVEWTQLYPKGTDERQQIHQLINRLGRNRQKDRQMHIHYRLMGLMRSTLG